MDIPNLVLPSWAKYVAYGLLVVVAWGHGYTSGIEHVYKNQAEDLPKIVYVQGKITKQVVTKYIKAKVKQDKIDTEIKNEGTAYPIKFPDDGYSFNNEYVRLFDSSVTGTISSLSSGESAGDSGVTVSEQLNVSINNHEVARKWKARALQCEEWVKLQEEESIK